MIGDCNLGGDVAKATRSAFARCIPDLVTIQGHLNQ